MSRKIYYHFLSPENAIDDLKNKRIKISTLDSLNDPFELLPNLKYEYKERQTYHKIRRAISGKWGFLCFSETWEEPLLWSHYACHHKGIALGFEITNHELVKVKYTEDPIRTQIELTDNQKENEELFLQLAKIKYKKWEYEDESRLLVQLDDCVQIKSSYFIPFEENLKLTEIRLGAKYNYGASPTIIKELAKELSAKIIPSRLEWQGYKIRRDGGERSRKFA